MVLPAKPHISSSILPGFEIADQPIKPRLIISVAALEKQGKSNFALTAPGPIAYINLDRGLEGVIQKFQGEKIIGVADFSEEIQEIARSKGKPETIKDVHDKLWDRISEKYRLGLQHGRTVVVDTGTKLWEILRLARLGKLTQVMPHHYGPVNAEFESFLNEAYDYDSNLILLHKRKAEYVNDKRTGQFERAGYKDIGFIVQANLLAYRLGPAEREAGDLGFRVHVEDCRQNPAINGEELPNEMATFANFGCLVLPGVDASAWE